MITAAKHGCGCPVIHPAFSSKTRTVDEQAQIDYALFVHWLFEHKHYAIEHISVNEITRLADAFRAGIKKDDSGI